MRWFVGLSFLLSNVPTHAAVTWFYSGALGAQRYGPFCKTHVCISNKRQMKTEAGLQNPNTARGLAVPAEEARSCCISAEIYLPSANASSLHSACCCKKENLNHRIIWVGRDQMATKGPTPQHQTGTPTAPSHAHCPTAKPHPQTTTLSQMGGGWG